MMHSTDKKQYKNNLKSIKKPLTDMQQFPKVDDVNFTHETKINNSIHYMIGAFQIIAVSYYIAQ